MTPKKTRISPTSSEIPKLGISDRKSRCGESSFLKIKILAKIAIFVRGGHTSGHMGHGGGSVSDAGPSNSLRDSLLFSSGLAKMASGWISPQINMSLVFNNRLNKRNVVFNQSLRTT